MVFAITNHESLDSVLNSHPDAEFFDLGEYIEHKIGMSIPEIVKDSPERFRVIEEEALRDLAVMSEISGRDCIIRLLPDTLSNSECARLISKQGE